jgi:DNA-directed RNA polymerase subunit RPC12/RpoP
MAGSMFPPMAIFGILFTAIGAVNAYNIYKTIKENSEKPHEHQDFYKPEETIVQKEELRCPYCGAPIHSSDEKCEYCGSRL